MANDFKPTAYDLLQNKIETEVKNADDYITEIMGDLRNACSMLTQAMQTASTEYDLIMKAEAGKPLFEEIFLGVLGTVIPSLKLFQGGAKLVFGIRVPESGAKGVARAVKITEEHYFNLAKNFKDPVTANWDKEEEVGAAQSQLNARNATAKKVFGECLDILQEATDLARESRKYIRMERIEALKSGNQNLVLLDKIVTDFKSAGLHGIRRVGKDQLLSLSNQLLYDMLRGYVGANVVFKIVDGNPAGLSMFGPKPPILLGADDTRALTTKRISDLPTMRGENLVSGINSEQRKEIYKRFGNGGPITPGGPSRPGIKDYKDLIRHWGAKTVGLTGKPYTFN